MNHFFIIANPEKEESLAAAEHVAAYIAGHGGSPVLRLRESAGGATYLYTDPAQVPQDTECIIAALGRGGADC